MTDPLPATRPRAASRAGLVAAGATVAVMALPALLAPGDKAAPGFALAALLLVGTSMHVAATPWLFGSSAARAVARSQPGRFVAAPAALLVLGIALGGIAPTGVLEWVLLGAFTWQFHHYAKQNVGVVALCATAAGAPPPGRTERRAIVASGVAGAGAVWANPGLLAVRLHGLGDGVRLVGLVVVLTSVAVGAGALARRRRPDRPPGVVALELVALCFPLPLFLFASPFAAASGMALAHGVQYLALVGAVAAGPLTARRRAVRVVVLVNVAVLGGLALRAISRIHGGLPAGHVLFGAYLGLYASHFVLDGGLWRLSRPEARRFVADALPFLQLRPAMDRATI